MGGHIDPALFGFVTGATIFYNNDHPEKLDHENLATEQLPACKKRS